MIATPFVLKSCPESQLLRLCFKRISAANMSHFIVVVVCDSAAKLRR